MRVVMKALSPVTLSIMMLSVTLTDQVARAQTAQPKSEQKAQAPAPTPPRTGIRVSPGKPTAAPETPPTQLWMSVSVVRVKPDMINEWIDLNKTVVIPALKKAGVKQREVWQTAQFGEQFEYVVITPIDSFAQFDGDSPIRKGLGEEGYRGYLDKSRRMIAGVHTYANLVRADLSHIGKMNGPPKFAVVTSVYVAPGRAQELESLLKTDVLPAVGKTEISGYFVSQTVFGGDVNVYTTVALHDSFDDIGKGSYVIRGMGQTAYDRFIRKTVGIVVRLERSVIRYNAELSFGGEQVGTNKQ